MGIIRLLGTTGDEILLEWDNETLTTESPEGLQIVEEAERIIRDHLEKGRPVFAAYHEEKNMEMIQRFDPNASEIILALPLQGG